MIIKQVEEIMNSDEHIDSRINNILAIIKYEVKDISWVGIYLYDEIKDRLYLGPFQGKTACMSIENGKGVCGKSFEEDKDLAVADVSKFKGHILCDSDSKSEIVLPIHKDGKKIGVLDIDSYSLNRFKNESIPYFKEIIKLIEEEI